MVSSNKSLVLPTFVVVVSFIVLMMMMTTITTVVEAFIPSNVPCECANGATRDTSVDYCYCTGCSSPNVLPFCTFEASAQVRFAITYNWTQKKDLFPYATAEDNIKIHLGISDGDFTRISRISTFEGENELVVGYLIKGEEVNQLYTDVYASPKPSYLTKEPEALNIWQLGTVQAEPGVFAKHFSSGNILARAAISDGEFVVNDRQLEYFIAAIVITIFLPIFDAILGCVFKPTPEELDEQQIKYGNEEEGNGKFKSSSRK